MLVVFDTSILSLVLAPSIKPPNDPRTNKPVENSEARLDFLLTQLEEVGARVLVPAPVWGEFLVIADESGPDYVAEIDRRAGFEIVPFDGKSAVEAAASQRRALLAGNKKMDLKGSRQCIKADRQIVAIAKTQKAERIYSSDEDIRKLAAEVSGLTAIMLWELPEPPAESAPLPFDDADESDPA